MGSWILPIQSHVAYSPLGPQRGALGLYIYIYIYCRLCCYLESQECHSGCWLLCTCAEMSWISWLVIVVHHGARWVGGCTAVCSSPSGRWSCVVRERVVTMTDSLIAQVLWTVLKQVQQRHGGRCTFNTSILGLVFLLWYLGGTRVLLKLEPMNRPGGRVFK